MKIFSCLFSFYLLSVTAVNAQLALTPPMGWNSWNYFGKNEINEQVVKEVIDAADTNGLRAAGYIYIVVDGGWRDNHLSSDGRLLPHPEKFPHGMKALADYAHSKGFKFGLHTLPGTDDCIGDPVGGYGKEEIHIQQFIDWGVDFIKLDLCRMKGEWNEELIKNTYFKWHDILAQKKSNIVLSISAYKFREWNPAVGQMSRTTEDISAVVAGMSGCKAIFDDTLPAAINKWHLLSVMDIAEETNKWAAYARPGYWNDPDMLVTGDQGLSLAEQQSHFALWCIMSAPLMLGNDPRHMSAAEKSIILNRDALAVNQDPTEQGTRIYAEDGTEIWVKKMQNNLFGVLLLNRDKLHARKITLDFRTLGIRRPVQLRDIYRQHDIGRYRRKITMTVPAGSSVFLRVSGSK